MKPKSRLQERLETAERERDKLHVTLYCVLHEKPTATVRAKDSDGIKAVMRLYRPTGAAGGIVVIVTTGKDHQSYQIHYLDALHDLAMRGHVPSAWYAAVSQMRVVRDNALNIGPRAKVRACPSCEGDSADPTALGDCDTCSGKGVIAA